MSSNLRIDGARLWQSLMEMAEIGPGVAGGNRRLALTDEDKAGRDLFVRWCREAGMTVSVDRMGNIFARREGTDPDAAPVMTGSHLDTQPHGGRFDGVYGVLAGLEVVRSLNDLGIATRAPVEVVCWTNEEGSRFSPAMVGSGVFAGTFSLDYGLGRMDADGKSLGGELERIGYAGDVDCAPRSVGTYFEAHIEQGPILENAGKAIGIVTGGQGSCWYEVIFTGQDSHAGTTPMDVRRDAMVGAARLVEAVYALGMKHAERAVATVGRLDVSPNSRNTIPGEVSLDVDMRAFDDDILTALEDGLQESAAEIAAELGLGVECRFIARKNATHFAPEAVAMVRDAAARQGLPAMEIVSGAGHDAIYLATVAPTAMIFIPCEGGLSHNEAETITPEQSAAGASVLLDAMLEAAGRG
jgi:N-carbamoyl-L-amino-acid hydrolase